MSVLNSDKYYKSSKIMDMFKVEQLDCPDMTVHVNSGTIIFKNQIINFSEQNTEVLTAPRIGSWLIVLSINDKGELVYTYGVQSTEQKMIPALPNECFHLCIIEVSATSAMVTNDMIYDLRQIYTYSSNNDTMCACKCALEEKGFSDEDRKQLKEFYDKYEEVSLALDKVKLALEPRKEYHVLSDSGLEYIVKFKDTGEPYFVRVGYDDNPKPDDSHKDYKFVYNKETVNIVNESSSDFVQVAVKIKSFDNLNSNMKCTLFLRCNDTTIYGSNYTPNYRENEFVIDNLDLTKSGYQETFSLKFHNTGNHVMSLLLYDNETKTLIDKGYMNYAISFENANMD